MSTRRLGLACGTVMLCVALFITLTGCAGYVGPDGKVYQKDFGKKTVRLASKIKEYNPDGNWQLVQDVGIQGVIFER